MGNTTAGEGFCQENSSLAEGLLLVYKGAMTSDKMLTTGEVAVRLGVSLRRVRQLIEQGRLPSQQFGRDHLIKESDLKLVEDRKPGRPPKQPVDGTKQLNEALTQTTDGQATSQKARKSGKKSGKK